MVSFPDVVHIKFNDVLQIQHTHVQTYGVKSDLFMKSHFMNQNPVRKTYHPYFLDKEQSFKGKKAEQRKSSVSRIDRSNIREQLQRNFQAILHKESRCICAPISVLNGETIQCLIVDSTTALL